MLYQAAPMLHTVDLVLEDSAPKFVGLEAASM